MRLTVSVCAVALVISATAAFAIDPSQKCAATKLGVAGKYEFCRLKAAAKALKSNATPDYSKCDAAFGAKWGAAETKAMNDCPTNGDQAAQQSQLSANAGATIVQLTGAARYTDGGDGTIADSQSGLTWEKKVKLDASQDLSNLHDANNTYQWAGTCTSNAAKYCQPNAAASTACTNGVEGAAIGCAQCSGGDGSCNASNTIWTWLVALNTANFAGHGDWRLPTHAELEAIIDYDHTTFPAVNAAFQGATCGATCTDLTQAACSCTSSAGYWSASTTATSTTSAWTVSFGNGYTFPNSKATAYGVRAVR